MNLTTARSYQLSIVRRIGYVSFLLAFLGMLGIFVHELVVSNILLMKLWLVFCLGVIYWVCSRSTLRNFCWRASMSDTGVQVRTITGTHMVHWSRIRGIARASIGPLKLYALETPDTSFIIPASLDKQSELFHSIRKSLPPDVTPAISFTYVDPAVASYATLLFTAVAISFAVVGLLGVLHGAIAACVPLFLGICILGFYSRIAKTVNTSSSGFTIVSWYGLSRQIRHDEIRSIHSTFRPLPIGLFMNTKAGWFFLSGQLKGLDDLQDLIQERTPTRLDHVDELIVKEEAIVKRLGTDAQSSTVAMDVKTSEKQKQRN
jgi:hypothetical protein